MKNSKIKMFFLLITMTVILASLAGCKGEDKKTNTKVTDPAPTEKLTEVLEPTLAPEPTEVPKKELVVDSENPILKDVYADYFYMGAVLSANGLQNTELKELVATQFNSLTLENEMKPDAILDYNTSVSDPKYDDCPAINFSRAEAGLKFATENGMKMRGHTLVWHSQTPRWFFTVGYSNAADAPFVTKELMLKRMENYIRQVLEYTQTNYPDLIYAWDVVNEAFNPGDGHVDGLRTETSLWYQVIGDEYLEKAFEYARKYAAPGVKLFYNDYNTEDMAKVIAIKKLATKLIEQGTIDGVGLQSHISVSSPSLTDIDKSVREFAELGLEIQITELDVDMETNTEEDLIKQASRYKRLFLYIMNWKKSGINLSSITFWGTTDNRSWLNDSTPSFPLLFDEKLQKKPAFFGVLQDADIPLN